MRHTLNDLLRRLNTVFPAVLVLTCVALPLTGQTPCAQPGFSGAPGRYYPATYSGAAIGTGDFNGDGSVDVAVGGGSSIMIFLAQGSGFAPPTVLHLPSGSPTSIQVADLNGDGKLDLLVTLRGYGDGGGVVTFLGDGNGGFQQKTFVGGGMPNSAVVADFNGDGKPDVVVANNGSTNVTILLGIGDGSFQSPITGPTVADGSMQIVAGDFNGDGKLDVALVNYPSGGGPSSLTVLPGDGTGHFGSPLVTSLNNAAFSLAAGDFNSDGKLDVAVANYYADTAGTSGTTVSVLLGDGSGYFGQPANFPMGGYNPFFVASRDVNGDGKLDLIAGGGGGTIGILLGNGSGGFSAPKVYPAGEQPGQIAFGDFNQDGKVDFAIVAGSPGFSILLGDGQGGVLGPVNLVDLSVGSPIPQQANPSSLTVGDFNGDGKQDIAVVRNDGQLSVHLGDGQGGFGAPRYFALSFTPDSVAQADLNGDGKVDLVVGGYPEVQTWLGDGSGGFTPKATVSVGGNPTALAIADFNQDGKADLAAIVQTGGQAPLLAILFGDGTGGFGPATTYALSSVPGYPGVITVADFNGDGKLDIAVGTDLGIYLFLATGGGAFAPARVIQAGTTPYFVATGDLNGDGKADLVCINLGNPSTVSVLLGNGNGSFGTPTSYPLNAPAVFGIGVADFNGDGKADVVIIENNSSAVLLFLGDGAGGLSPASSGFLTGQGPQQLVIADINGDGKPDVLTANYDGRSISVLTSAPNAAPTATNNGPVCAGRSLNLTTPTVSGATYSWTGPNGFTSALQNPTIPNATAANAGTYSVTVTVAGCSSAPGTTNVVVNAAPATPVITAPASTAAGTTGLTASVVSHAGSSWFWTIQNGTITSGQGTSQITFTAGMAGTALTLSVTETNTLGCVSAPGNATVTVAGPPELFYTLPPCRVLDTRNPTGPLGGPSLQPGATRTFDVAASTCGIPAAAKAISVNLAVTGPVGSGHLTLYPGDAVQAPLAGTINFSANQTRANNAVLPLASDGSGTIKVLAGTGGTVDFILDVNGYFQ
jgi:hypothetical protein